VSSLASRTGVGHRKVRPDDLADDLIGAHPAALRLAADKLDGVLLQLDGVSGCQEGLYAPMRLTISPLDP
jgi:hypothetical protein